MACLLCWVVVGRKKSSLHLKTRTYRRPSKFSHTRITLSHYQYPADESFGVKINFFNSIKYQIPIKFVVVRPVNDEIRLKITSIKQN